MTSFELVTYTDFVAASNTPSQCGFRISVLSPLKTPSDLNRDGEFSTGENTSGKGCAYIRLFSDLRPPALPWPPPRLLRLDIFLMTEIIEERVVECRSQRTQMLFLVTQKGYTSVCCIRSRPGVFRWLNIIRIYPHFRHLVALFIL